METSTRGAGNPKIPLLSTSFRFRMPEPGGRRRSSILLLPAHSPERAQSEISKSQAETNGDNYAPRARPPGLVLGIFPAECDSPNAGHEQEDKSCNFQPQLVQNFAQR